MCGRHPDVPFLLTFPARTRSPESGSSKGMRDLGREGSGQTAG